MWTGGPPPTLPEQAVVLTRSTSVRPPPATKDALREAELQELRQRGLARLLNKHFTETTTRLAAEKAAADAALADLEARKAQTSEFRASGDGEISPLDALYLSVNQWRQECRRKEKETLLLYQRYVDKFGATGKVVVPPTSGSLTPVRKTVRRADVAWPPPKSPVAAATSSSSWVPETPPAVPVPQMAAAIESVLEEYLKKGDVMILPSAETSMGLAETFQKAYEKEEAEFRHFVRRQMELKGADARSPEWTCPERQVYTGPGAFGQGEMTPSTSDPFIRTVGETKWKDDEKKNSGSSQGGEDDEEAEDENQDGLGSLYLRNRDEDDMDMFSIVSGLTTVNSAETRRIWLDCEQSVVTFLKDEQNAIRKLMMQEEEQAARDPDQIDAMTSGSNSTRDSALVGSVAKKAAEQAESMALQMQKILDDFQSKSGAVGSPALDEQGDKKEPRRYETSNPEENWMVYYDETYQREYYHELNTNRTQWEAPDKEADATSASTTERAAPDLLMLSPSSSDALFSPDTAAATTTLSRVALYRRKRRRERKRRLLVVVAVGLAMLAGGAYYLYTKHQQTAVQFQVEEQARAEAMAAEEAALAAALKAEVEAATREQAEREEAESLAAMEREEAAAREQQQQDEDRICREEEERLAREAEEEEERQKRMQEEERQKALRRPWGCNIPFAYLIHPRCRRLASENPIFDLHALVTVMIQ